MLRVLKWFIRIVGGLLLGIAVAYCYSLLRNREIRALEMIADYWYLSVAAFAVVALYFGLYLLRRKRKALSTAWDVCKPATKLVPRDLKIQKYVSAYVQRASDTNLEEFLNNRQSILILGKPKLGKTRAAFKGIKQLRDRVVIQPRAQELRVEELRLPAAARRNVTLLLDDLNKYVDEDVDGLLERLRKRTKDLIVVATCRTGPELDVVREGLLSLYRGLRKVELEEISIEAGKRLAEDARIEWRQAQFDGSPGSVILDLEDMTMRYKALGDSRVVLKAMKLLNRAGIFICKEGRIKDVCEVVFELPPESLRRYRWDALVSETASYGFITIERDVLHTYIPYLEVCVNDYEPNKKDLLKLKEVLIQQSDSGCLYYLGNTLLRDGDLSSAEGCLRAAITIYPQYAKAHNTLGFLLAKQGDIERRLRHYGKAEEQYLEARAEHHAALELSPSFVGARNSLGYAIAGLGQVKEEKQEPEEATILFREAEKEYLEAIRLCPEHAPSHGSYAYLLERLGSVDKAESEFRKAIELAPEWPFAHQGLGDLLRKSDTDRFPEARAEYRKAIRLKPDYPSAHCSLGYMLVRSGKPDDAIAEYQESIKGDPSSPVPLRLLGDLYVRLGQYDNAEREYKKALSVSPKYQEVELALECLAPLRQMEKYQVPHPALVEYRERVGASSRLPQLRITAGYVAQVAGDAARGSEAFGEAEKWYHKAALAYEAALEDNPDDEQATLGLAIAYEKLGEDLKAQHIFRRAIRLEKGREDALRSYVKFLTDRDWYNELEEILRAEVSANPESIGVRGMYAKALARLGDLEEAEKQLQCLLDRNPSHPRHVKDIGIIYEAIGDSKEEDSTRQELYEAALSAYRSALVHNKTYPSARRHLANVLVKLGRLEEAEREYRAVNGYRIVYPKNNRDFGNFLLSMKRKEEATQELTLALRLFRQLGQHSRVREVEELLGAIGID